MLLVWNFFSVVFLNKVFYIYSKIVLHPQSLMFIGRFQAKLLTRSGALMKCPNIKGESTTKAEITTPVGKDGSLRHQTASSPLCAREL